MMSENQRDIETELQKFMDGQDSELNGRQIFGWIEDYWRDDVDLNEEVIELASLSVRDQLIGGFDAMLLCYRSCLHNAIEGKVIRP